MEGEPATFDVETTHSIRYSRFVNSVRSSAGILLQRNNVLFRQRELGFRFRLRVLREERMVMAK